MFKSNIYTVILSLCVLASCDGIMDDAVCPSGGGSTRAVTLKLAMDDTHRQTRSAWGDGYDAENGVAFDNRLSVDAIRVIFYRSSDNSYVGEASDIMYWAAPSDATDYRITGNVAALDIENGTDYKVMVVANAQGGGTNLGNLTFSIEDAAYPQGYIPMWGVGSFKANGDELQDAGTIDMLRAMAKVEVVLSNEMIANGYTLDGVQLTHHNSMGYCLPAQWNGVSKTAELGLQECFRALHSHISTALPLIEVEADKSYWIYVPEFDVNHTAVNRPSISVVLGDGSSVPLEFPEAIRFGSYDSTGTFVDGSEQNIVRNHIYRFNITAIASGLEVEYEVLSWEDGGTWDRGEFAYPTYHNPVVPDYINPSAAIVKAPVMKYNNAEPEADAFVAWFKLTGPTGQMWTPVVDKSDTEYQIKVYDDGGTLLGASGNWIAADKWYKIVVIPLKAENSGTIVKFGITYTQDWMPDGTSMYLIINGKAGEIAWPESGNDPKIIEIKQI